MPLDITLTFGPNGVTQHTSGIKGTGCTALPERIAKKLGATITKAEPTAEYYELPGTAFDTDQNHERLT